MMHVFAQLARHTFPIVAFVNLLFDVESWSREGWLTLRTAFSRDQPQKRYVQDVMMEDSELIWKLVEVRLNKSK